MLLKADDWLDAMFYLGGFDVAFPRHVGTLVQPGEWALDIGAQKGWFSMLLARAVGPGGTVFAFEPDPRAFSQCVIHRDRNELPQIVALPMAVGDTTGTVSFLLNATLGWSSCFPDAAQRAQITDEIEVRFTTIDEVLRERRTSMSPPAVVGEDRRRGFGVEDLARHAASAGARHPDAVAGNQSLVAGRGRRPASGP